MDIGFLSCHRNSLAKLCRFATKSLSEMYLEPKSYQFTFAFKLPLSTSVTDINCEEKLNQTEPIMLSADFPGIFRLQMPKKRGSGPILCSKHKAGKILPAQLSKSWALLITSWWLPCFIFIGFIYIFWQHLYPKAFSFMEE